MTIVTLELVVAGVVLVLIAVLAGLAWVRRRGKEMRDSITETQARQNAAPLTTAILGSDRRERKST